MKKIKRAFISVCNKNDVVELASFLSKNEVEIIATPGTQKMLEKSGVKVIEQATLGSSGADYMAGRFKSVNPLIYASIAANPQSSQEMEQLESIGGLKVDLVVMDLPDISGDAQTQKSKEQKLDESKDLGRINLVNVAAKFHKHVALALTPVQYKTVLNELQENDLKLSPETRKNLALEAYEFLSDHYIHLYKELNSNINKKQFLPETLFLKYHKVQDLRYGENPHQKAIFYQEPGFRGINLCDLNQVKGPTLSYNNLCDLNAALSIALEFEKDTAVIVKHTNPTGVAIDKDPTKAYLKARDVDRVSAFG